MAYASFAVHLAFLVALFIGLVNKYSPIDPFPVNEPEQELLMNDDLSQAEHLFVDEILAPEDVAISVDKKTFYLSLCDGQIVKMKSDASEWKPFTRTGFNNLDDNNNLKDISLCGNSLASEPICGRPLGLHFVPANPYRRYLSDYNSQVENDEVLLVADAYKGLLLIDKNGKVITLLNSVNGKKLHFTNALAIAKDGTVYLSDSSSRFQRNRVVYEALEGQKTGRIIAFHPESQISTEIITNIPFPNGIALSEDNKSLFIALTSRFKVIKLNLDKKEDDNARTNTLVHLPGTPDNLLLQNGILWVGIGTKRNKLTTLLNRNLFLRKLVSLLPYESLLLAFKPYGMLAAVDVETGKIFKTYQDPSGKIGYVAGVHFHEDFAYITSWKNPYLARLKLPSYS